jgi:hypothetical protein
MGLDTSHNCWHGPYSAFNRFRHEIAKAAGIPLDSMEGYEPMFPTPEEDQAERVSWEKYKSDPICILLDHSDCDGEIANEHCLALAARLEEIAPKLIQGGLMALRFAKGLRDAAEAGEDVEFR